LTLDLTYDFRPITTIVVAACFAVAAREQVSFIPLPLWPVGVRQGQTKLAQLCVDLNGTLSAVSEARAITHMEGSGCLLLRPELVDSVADDSDISGCPQPEFGE